MNGKFVGEHNGGYAGFYFDISGFVNLGKENTIEVRVSNSFDYSIIPLVGDFNFYGGIYRDVYIETTDKIHLSHSDFGSQGVYFKPLVVEETKAAYTVQALIKNNYQDSKNCTIQFMIFDGDQLIINESQQEMVNPNSVKEAEHQFVISNPKLWQGIDNPFMYKVLIKIISDGMFVDEVESKIGVRSFSVDSEKGAFLNNQSVKLRGVTRHQDRPEIGNALHKIHHEEDARIIKEMGSNSIRLAHYHHAPYFYDLMDRDGMLVWAEIPFVGQGGYVDFGFMNTDSFKDNVRMQLNELIKQNYNHPSIVMWGLFNELTIQADVVTQFIKELNDLAKSLDPARLVTAATNQNGVPINLQTELIAWNEYFGWYGGNPKDLGNFFDSTHKSNKSLKIGLSEYGAGASVYHQQEDLTATSATSYWHPENWQLYFHSESWKQIAERDFVWGSFVWNLFDFGAAHRSEGDRDGINDKGLVTFDRKTRKDAFYFYKANWNKEEKFVHIASCRCVERHLTDTEVQVFSNDGDVELSLNGKVVEKKAVDNYATTKFTIKLLPGINQVVAKSEGSQMRCDWTLI